MSGWNITTKSTNHPIAGQFWFYIFIGKKFYIFFLLSTEKIGKKCL